MTRESLLDEYRIIIGGGKAGWTDAKAQRLREIREQLARCICRTCEKEYLEEDFTKFKGFCSAKCMATKAKQCGYRRGMLPIEYACLKKAGEIGSQHVVK